MSRRNISDQVRWTDQPTYSPSCSVEIFACRTHGKSESLDLRRQRGNAGKGDVIQAVVDFVGKDYNIVLHTKISDFLQLRLGKNFANWVVWSIEHDHLGLGGNSGFQLSKIDSPLRR